MAAIEEKFLKSYSNGSIVKIKGPNVPGSSQTFKSSDRQTIRCNRLRCQFGQNLTACIDNYVSLPNNQYRYDETPPNEMKVQCDPTVRAKFRKKQPKKLPKAF